MKVKRCTGQREGLATVDAVARRLGLSPSRVYELGRTGRLPPIKLGPGTKGAVRWDWNDVERFIEEHRRSTPPAA